MGLVNSLVPSVPARGLPTNITPNTGAVSQWAGGIMRNGPPLVSGPYNLINSLVHAFQGTLGEHGPAPATSLVGKLFQYFNPSYDQSSGGTAVAPAPAGQTPAAPVTTPPPAAGDDQGAGYVVARNNLNQGMLRLVDPATAWNANRAAFGPTWQQIMNPGSAIGPMSAVSNPYVGQFFHPSHEQGMSGAQAVMMSILSRMQP